jgi:hypothetical protein
MPGDGVRLHPQTCGTPSGLEAHRVAGTQPCTWCLAAAGLHPGLLRAAEERAAAAEGRARSAEQRAADAERRAAQAERDGEALAGPGETPEAVPGGELRYYLTAEGVIVAGHQGSAQARRLLGDGARELGAEEARERLA